TIRNAIVFRAAVPITTRVGRECLAGNDEIAWGSRALRGGPANPAQLGPSPSSTAVANEARADARAAAEAWRFASSHPGRWAAVAMAKAGRLWRVGSEPPGDAATGPWLEARVAGIDLIAIGSIAIFATALWGIARVLTSPRRWYQSLGILVLVYFT